MTTSIGKTLRLAHLFDPDTGTSAMLPMDHANEEPDYTQLEHPDELIGDLAGAGVNAFLFRRVIASVEQALHNGADAVVPTFFIGPQTETYLLPQLGALADECSRLGVPLVAVRVASEEGADIIKTWYTGDADSFAKVLEYSLVPVVVAGGLRADNDRPALEMVRGAMDAGACGVAMGRKIWQSCNPVGLAKAVIAVIRNGATVDDAMQLLAAGPV
jgi:DhnA family fructose-bisphosphate aldolase class Ia